MVVANDLLKAFSVAWWGESLELIQSVMSRPDTTGMSLSVTGRREQGTSLEEEVGSREAFKKNMR